MRDGYRGWKGEQSSDVQLGVQMQRKKSVAQDTLAMSVQGPIDGPVGTKRCGWRGRGIRMQGKQEWMDRWSAADAERGHEQGKPVGNALGETQNGTRESAGSESRVSIKANVQVLQ